MAASTNIAEEEAGRTKEPSGTQRVGSMGDAHMVIIFP
jgi:hypothetical protein